MKFTDKQGNLFELPKDEYIFAHCIAADLKWCGGIAPILIVKEFDAEKKCRYQEDGGKVMEKLNVGESFIVDCDKGVIANLITKEGTYDKPTYETVTASLEDLRDYMEDYGYGKLALPHIGCGIDGLQWEVMKYIIQGVFAETDIEIDCRYF